MSAMRSVCPGCRLEMPACIGASYDDSYNTSPECWEIFTEILGREFGNAVLFGQVHQLTVDTYAAQHAGGGHRDKSVIIHLGGLHLVLDRGLRPTAVPPLLQQLSAVVRVWPHLLPPADMSAFTVFDVALAESMEDHARLVREWAMFVWRAWSPHHQQIRDFVVEHLYPKEQNDHKTASAFHIAPHNPPPRVLPPAPLPSSRRRAAL